MKRHRFHPMARGIGLLSCAAMLGLTLASPLAAGVAKVSSITIPMPQDDQPTPLKHLSRGQVMQGSKQEHERRSIAEVTAIRIEELPAPGSEPGEVLWWITTGNSRPIMQPAIVKLRLLDQEKGEVASARTRVMLSRGTEGKEVKIKMKKIQAGAWEQAKFLSIEVAWHD